MRTGAPVTLVVAVLALVAALVGTAVAGDPVSSDSALTKKKVKKLVKKEVAKLLANAVGPPGPPGPAGRPGQDARALFAYVGDSLEGEASIRYGSGVTAVEPADTEGQYRLTFNRSVRNCVAQANTGLGDPLGGRAAYHRAGIASVSLVEAAPDNELLVKIWHSASAELVDSSFLITVTCGAAR